MFIHVHLRKLLYIFILENTNKLHLNYSNYPELYLDDFNLVVTILFEIIVLSMFF